MLENILEDWSVREAMFFTLFRRVPDYDFTTRFTKILKMGIASCGYY